MNRKRNKADLIALLGEPLPLPYKAELIKSESVLEVQPSRRHVLLINANDVEKNSAEYEFFELPPESIPLPIWRRPRQTPVSSQTEIIDLIENKISQIRVSSSGADISKLQKIETELTEISQVAEENTELDILQLLSSHEAPPPKRHIRIQLSWKMLGIIICCFVFFCTVSWALSDILYQYCYYLC